MPLIHYNAPYLQYYLFHYLPAATTIALLPATESTEFPLEEMLVYIFFFIDDGSSYSSNDGEEHSQAHIQTYHIY